jgi:nicotinic acid mononucleotide adenylyltransferase
MDVSEYRKDMFRLVGELGISVIYRNMVNKIDLMYLDVCIEDGEYSYLDIIKSILATPNDMAVVLYPNGETDRLEPICRSSDNILIFKGSFNPPHYGHMEMMKMVEKELGVDGSFVISLDTFGKGLVDPKDILHWFKMINDLGYRVILNRKPLFRDFVNLFNNRMNKLAKLHFVMGEDTAIRFVRVTPKDIELSATRIEDGQTYTQECVYHVFKRNVDAILPKKFKIYGHSVATSSTDIRKNLNFEYLDDKTINYILKNKLYQTEKNYV